MGYLKIPHPGEILERDFLKPLALSENALARAIGVSSKSISEIISGRRAITADTDLRLARFFSLSEGYWLRLQVEYDVTEAKRVEGEAIVKIKPYNNDDKMNETPNKTDSICQPRNIEPGRATSAPRSEFARRALEFRSAFEASGEKLLSLDEIVEEVRERRGERE